MVDTSKYEGKTAAELIEMLRAQEEFQGKQAGLIGELRAANRALDAQAKAGVKPVESGTTRKDQFRTVDLTAEEADQAILNPRKGLGEVLGKTREAAVEEAEQRVMAKIAQKQQLDAQVDAFMRNNPVLQKWQDVFSVAGAQIFNANPNAPLGEILEAAKKSTLEWLQQKGIKAEDDSTKIDRVKAGITTSGGAGNRDTAADRGNDDRSAARASTDDADRDNILGAISEIKTWKEKRMLPPRSR